MILLFLFMIMPIMGAYAEDSSQPKQSSTTTEQAAPSLPSRPTPAQIQQQMEQMMGPMMAMMVSQMIEGMSKTLAKPEVAGNYAAFMRNYYLALVKQGFSEEQAMRIISSGGLPGLVGKQ